MKLYMSDLYRIEVSYPLDEVKHDILYYLYQPIIGTQALQLYMMLNIEGKRMSRFLNPSPLTRLTSFLTMSLLDIEKSLKALEAIGLLKTFVKHDHSMTFYVYQLLSPLSLRAFFKNQILSSLLYESLSKEDYQQTIQYFQMTKENLQDFEDITASFQDVFTLQRHKQGKQMKLGVHFKEEIHNDVQVTYDMDLLKKNLADYQVNRSLLSQDDYTYITQLATVYSLDAFTLAGLIKDAMKSKGLDRQLFKTNVKKHFEMDSLSKLKEVYHKQPLQYVTINEEQSPLVLHMKYLDNITPYELLKEKQGGSEPVFHDLMIVETLMMQLGLKPAVVNVLIEYVLGKNQNRLSKRYCEAIGASCARKKIETAMDAYNELMNNGEKEELEVIEQTVETIVENKEASQEGSDELMKLLHQLKEGQL